MNITNPQPRNPQARPAIDELMLASLVFASVGAITWAVRGTDGWGGIDGTIIPGMTWGLLWWYVCWRKGVDARGISLWLGLGIAVGGELGYGQYVSWIRGRFNVGDEIVPVAAWIGYAWFAICGVAWGGLGGIALGWALAGRKPLGVWLTRLMLPVGLALLARLALQTWPWLFFPNWDHDGYRGDLNAANDASAAFATQRTIIWSWLAAAVLCVVAWFAATRFRASRIIRRTCLCMVGIGIVPSVFIAHWLFFPDDQLGLVAGELGRHLGRTVYTNSQNAIVAAWWGGAILVAVLQRDATTLVAGSVIGLGFGVAFTLAAAWCLGYEFAPQAIDWWKVWELNAGFYLGALYALVLYWSLRYRDERRDSSDNDGSPIGSRWGETTSLACAVFLIVYLMGRDAFVIVGLVLGSWYVAAVLLTHCFRNGIDDRRQGISLVYSMALGGFILAWGASSQIGILVGLCDANAVTQYAWPAARIAIFMPIGLLVFGIGSLKMWQVLQDPSVSRPPHTAIPRVSAGLLDVMTMTTVVAVATIWPAKIGVLYVGFLAIAVFAFNRLNLRLDRTDGV